MQCHFLLEDRTGNGQDSYRLNGNVLLDRLHGATVSRKPYIVVVGGSDAIGALCYVNVAIELVTQANERQLLIGHIVHPTGSGGKLTVI